MRRCIYCLVEAGDSAFTSEHVLPRAFGTFEQNPTLDRVCANCNSYFGGGLELAFARDSVEGLLRMLYGVRPAEGVDHLRLERLRVTLGGDGPWSSCAVELRAEDGQVAVDLLPQVGFAHREGGRWTFITEEALADATRALPDYIDQTRMFLIARSGPTEERLVALLGRRGITFRPIAEGGPPPSEEGLAPVEVRAHLDSVIVRCAAKISFNYMTWVAGPDFAGSPSFDSVRSFIRWGTPAAYPLVVVRTRPILADDLPHLRQTRGHLLTVNWTHDRRHVVGQVSLFNSVTYAVSLARQYSGIWTPLRSGHHFDPESRRITRLMAARRLRRRR